MAVYRRSYRAYSGPRSSTATRFLIPARFAVMDLAQRRGLWVFFHGCFLPFLVEAGLIYLTHNPMAQTIFGITQGVSVKWIDAQFFLRCAMTQAFLAFVLAAWIGPGLVAPDLANGAIPLYLSRPFSRFEYVASKVIVLFGMLSLVTWVPNLLLFALQAGLQPGWLAANRRIGVAILVGSLLWIGLLSLVALALSATVRRRQTASLLLFGLFFAGAAFGEIWRTVIGNAWGRLLNVRYLVELIWYQLFDVKRPRFIGGVRADREFGDIPMWAAWTALLALSAFCVWLLDRRVRAKEIVR